MTFKVIALDLDGTLLTPQKILPESLLALQNARKSGAKVVIVTGRHHVAIHPFYQALELDTPAICCNGALLYDYIGKRVLTSDPLLPDQATQLVTLLDTHNIHGLMYADDAMFYSEVTGHITRTETWARTLPEHQRPVFKHVDSLGATARDVDKIWKFALTDSDIDKLKTLLKWLRGRSALPVNGHGMIKLISPKQAIVKVNALRSGLSHRVYQ